MFVFGTDGVNEIKQENKAGGEASPKRGCDPQCMGHPVSDLFIYRSIPSGLSLVRMEWMKSSRKIRPAGRAIITVLILNSIKNYLLFAIVSGTAGLSWIIRNLIQFHVKPGISSATEASVMYTGNYGIWERIGIPALSDWHFSFPYAGTDKKSNQKQIF